MILEAMMANAAALLGVTLILWAAAVRIDDVSFIDSFWGFGMALMAAVSWVQVDAPGPLATLLMIMAAVWGLRLAVYLFLRWRREGEDKRYGRMLHKDREEGRFALAALTKVFLGQAALLFLVCSPAQYGILEAGSTAAIGPLAIAGFALWMLGVTFETVGDWQLARFKADPANAGKILDFGLWRYTRHPNYFGDCCAWWGIWLASASTGWWGAALTAIGPLFLTFTLTRWSGKALLEAGMRKKHGDAFADYVARTSGFFPRPPRKSQ